MPTERSNNQITSRRRPARRANGSARQLGVGATTDLTSVLDSIRAIVRELRLSGRSSEQALGVSGAQLFVLQKLAEVPVQSLSELAARTHTDPSSVSVVVSRLVARGLVNRSASPDDARRVDISLSTNGRALARRAPRAAQAELIEAAAQLPAKQLKSLARDLSALVEKMADGREAE